MYRRLNPAALSAPLAKTAWFVGTALRHGRPHILLGVPQAGFGDQLLCTALFRELRKRGARQLWAMTHHPCLFEANPDIDRVVPPWSVYAVATSMLGGQVCEPIHADYIAEEDRWVPSQRHVIARMCELAGITGSVELRPYLTLRPEEQRQGCVATRQVCVMSSGMAARHKMLNRQWLPQNFQAVVDALRYEFDFVQVGAADDPLLDGAIDRRGLAFRPTAAILARSLAFVGQEGFLAHLARAVECRSVVVFGGFCRPEQTGYICNENFYSHVECAPCWTANLCNHDRKCMTMITPDQVVPAVRRQVERFGSALPVAEEEIPAGDKVTTI
jgi:hypothetical protein